MDRPTLPAPGLLTALLVERGVRDADLRYLRDGMRERSVERSRRAFQTAAERGVSPTELARSGEFFGNVEPIILDVYADGEVHLNDGRHRYVAAREAGATRILATVREYGPRGGLRSEKRVVVPLR